MEIYFLVLCFVYFLAGILLALKYLVEVFVVVGFLYFFYKCWKRVSN